MLNQTAAKPLSSKITPALLCEAKNVCVSIREKVRWEKTTPNNNDYEDQTEILKTHFRERECLSYVSDKEN